MTESYSVLRGLWAIVREAAQLVRRDAALYLAIVIYVLAGLIFLNAIGAADRLAFSIYFGSWISFNGFVLPTITVLADAIFIIHRFNSRRRLVVKRVFSTERLAYSLSGLCLLMALMIFQGNFTSVKNGMAVWQGGFRYDVMQANIDAFLHFGTDPWRWLYSVAENDRVRDIVEWNYNVFWFLLNFGALFFVATSPMVASVRTRYLACFMAVWILVGNILAALFLSAGPAFYGAVTGDTARFGEQLAFLARGAASSNSAAAYQEYLWSLYEAKRTAFATGISAFPSVHVGLAMLNALFVREYSRLLGAVALLYVAFVAVSSVYLAWHYAIDGYVAVIVVSVIYVVARKLIPADRRLVPSMPARTVDCPVAAATVF
ncbi:phosphatase PAP2 family protein [Mesorhizobium sp. VK23B]|uniref:Phosphatase PAP2 family protein n=1 Tax=Mesorhizobium dulcispinae TaxID=3072316 RepID=A0ABU4XK75_9HYPH|nr:MULTISPECIES: phosphatase PAP2 family protein [unclassified Mesorhizobium]MDX8468328.1 phosphatase PAP2 family protein [Mesorhizobium sp. VK23B]MDX8474666.1 phosphatase PAP2 family protein [Mesorhizobium sp. VK23A]MDX8519693.1 phosphatase PAP2 family protein [Mesorhizobium sp. VK23D]